MSKLGCPCGNLIPDSTDYLPYKGHLFADTEFFDLFELVSQEVAAFIRARTTGTEQEWLQNHLGNKAETGDTDVVYHIMSRNLIHACLNVYQCRKCGRVHVPRRDRSGWFESFVPEAQPFPDIFKKQ